MAKKNPLKVIFHYPDGTVSYDEIKNDYIDILRKKIGEAVSAVISDESYIALATAERR